MRFNWKQLSWIILVFVTAFTLAVPVLAQEEEDQGEKDKKEKGLPLKGSETLDFTTDEVTWMSLDVSPDGRQIVFDLLGDLYVLPIEGGEAGRILGDISFESQPRFSPDGKQIAFVSDRSGAENVWVANSDGSDPKAVSKGRDQSFLSPSWTPDGQYILVSRGAPGSRTASLQMYHKDGGSGVEVAAEKKSDNEEGAGGPGRNAPHKLGPVSSPDGRFIYFGQRAGLFNYNVQFPLWQIMRFDRKTGESGRITNAPGSAMRPQISPDGKNLVYATRFEAGTALRVRSLDTGAERWLAYPVTRDDQESAATRDTFPGYAFMPDGKSLIVPVNGKIHRIALESGDAQPVNFTARVQAEVAPRAHFESRVEDEEMVKARIIRSPTISPDGSRVVFSAFNRLWIQDLKSGQPERLTRQDVSEFMPSWSSDGRSIVYVTWATEEGGHIYRISASGGEPQRLTRHPAYYTDPIFSPDNQKIVFIMGAADDHLYSRRDEKEADHQLTSTPAEISGIRSSTGMDLKWIPASGGEPTLIAPAERAEHPHFTNDPERVFLSDPEGLISIRLDGLDRRTHLIVTGSGPGRQPPKADEIVLSPDGKRAFVSLQNKHFVVPVPSIGTDPVKLKITGKGDAAVPVTKMSAEGGSYLAWSPDGQSVTWALGSHLYRQALSADEPTVTEIEVDLARSRPQGIVVLSGARIVTMKGNEVIEEGDIVIENNRVKAVGAKGKVSIPSDARVIDVKGATILPGFVDTHAHMWAPWGLHQTQNWHYLANLAHGVTTTRDPQTSTDDVFSYADLVDSGMVLGPRIFSTGPGVFSRSGLDDKEATFAFIKRYRDAYRTKTLKNYMSGDRIVRQWVAMACREYGITPTAEGGLDMVLDLTMMADGISGLEHSLPIQPLYKDVAEYVARTKTYYTPTMLVSYGAPWLENYYFETTDVYKNEKLRRFIPPSILNNMIRRRGQWFMKDEYGWGIAEGLNKIVQAGGKVGVGSHGQLQGLGYHWELWSIASGGMSNHDALRAATLFGAQAIGYEQDLGSLEQGKLADLIVMEKNPLDDLKNTTAIRYVMKNGELYEAQTLNQIWPQQKELPKQFWWDDEPESRP